MVPERLPVTFVALALGASLTAKRSADHLGVVKMAALVRSARTLKKASNSISVPAYLLSRQQVSHNK